MAQEAGARAASRGRRRRPPPLAGTRVPGWSCWPGQPAVGVGPAVGVRSQASRPGRAAVLRPAPAWRPLRAPARPAGPKAAALELRTRPTLARAGSPSRGRGRVVEGAGRSAASGRPAARASWDPRALRLGVRWPEFLRGLGPPARGPSRSRAGLPRDRA